MQAWKVDIGGSIVSRWNVVLDDKIENYPWSTYRKNPKISDTLKFAVIILKVEQDGISLE